MSGERLPLAGPADVRRAAVGLVRADRRAFAGVLALNGLAAVAALGVRWAAPADAAGLPAAAARWAALAAAA